VTWLNPAAFLGLAALAVPVLVHLFGRPRARRERFPSLRFLQLSRQAPIRVSRPSDGLLLALRLLVIGVAVAALARPWWPALDQRRGGSRLTRVVIVDTSQSMLRPTGRGERALEAARREADRLIQSADAALRVETAVPGSGLRGSSDWLSSQPGRREIVVVSDFQSGAVNATDLETAADGIGLSFHRVAVEPAIGPVELATRRGGVDMTASATLDGPRTQGRWSAQSVATESEPPVIILAADSERSGVKAVLEAALSTVGRSTPANGPRRAVIVLPGAAGRERLLQEAHPPTEPWQGDFLLRLHRDPLLRAISADAAVGVAPLPGNPALTPVAATGGGNPLALAGEADVDGVARLVLFASTDAESVITAALIAAATRAIEQPPDPGEHDPSVVPDEQLRSWERAPAGQWPGDDRVNPGRWLWLFALLLLGVEALLRRAPRRALSAVDREERRERVA
jgi:hypothetical protein